MELKINRTKARAVAAAGIGETQPLVGFTSFEVFVGLYLLLVRTKISTRLHKAPDQSPQNSASLPHPTHDHQTVGLHPKMTNTINPSVGFWACADRCPYHNETPEQYHHGPHQKTAPRQCQSLDS